MITLSNDILEYINDSAKPYILMIYKIPHDRN